MQMPKIKNPTANKVAASMTLVLKNFSILLFI